MLKTNHVIKNKEMTAVETNEVIIFDNNYIVVVFYNLQLILYSCHVVMQMMDFVEHITLSS